MFPRNDSPFWPWLYYISTLAGAGLWMHFGYKSGFDIVKDGPALIGYLTAMGGLDIFNRWKHKREICQLEDKVKKLQEDENVEQE